METNKADDKSIVASDAYYHGTKADLKPGDLIVPGFNSNYGTRKNAKFI
ncbi:MAG: NAD(+)--rifampin ADP-ribosyltransferase, partial [Chitinophagaceae bacterium]|nr:NAD(+)--rifampin ADP-ribosyltransferase [Chitinophagaceae bacterium]